MGGGNSGVGFFPYFPPLKPRYVLWYGASYSLKNTVICVQETSAFQKSDKTKTLWLVLKNICTKYQCFYLFSQEEVRHQVLKAVQPVLKLASHPTKV